MKCTSCDETVTCQEHGESQIEEGENSGDVFYWCNACSTKYETALGAIVHMCDFERHMAFMARSRSVA